MDASMICVLFNYILGWECYFSFVFDMVNLWHNNFETKEDKYILNQGQTVTTTAQQMVLRFVWAKKWVSK